MIVYCKILYDWYQNFWAKSSTEMHVSVFSITEYSPFQQNTSMMIKNKQFKYGQIQRVSFLLHNTISLIIFCWISLHWPHQLGVQFSYCWTNVLSADLINHSFKEIEECCQWAGKLYIEYVVHLEESVEGLHDSVPSRDRCWVYNDEELSWIAISQCEDERLGIGWVLAFGKSFHICSTLINKERKEVECKMRKLNKLKQGNNMSTDAINDEFIAWGYLGRDNKIKCLSHNVSNGMNHRTGGQAHSQEFSWGGGGVRASQESVHCTFTSVREIN